MEREKEIMKRDQKETEIEALKEMISAEEEEMKDL
jgi:hypothetical protein